MSPLEAIRFQLNEIRPCGAVNCAPWPFRAGKPLRWGEGGKTGQTLADSDRQTAFRDDGSGNAELRDADRVPT
jgi:hypothetical protein